MNNPLIEAQNGQPIRHGIQLYKEGQYQECYKLFQDILKRRPDAPIPILYIEIIKIRFGTDKLGDVSVSNLEKVADELHLVSEELIRMRRAHGTDTR